MTNPNPNWLGLVVVAPQVGAPLVIGRPGASDLTLTSPVTRVFSRDDGILVQTEGGSRYLVGIAGNTYRFQHVSDPDEAWDRSVDLEIDPHPPHVPNPHVTLAPPVPVPLPRARAPRASTIRAPQPSKNRSGDDAA